MYSNQLFNSIAQSYIVQIRDVCMRESSKSGISFICQTTIAEFEQHDEHIGSIILQIG